MVFLCTWLFCASDFDKVDNFVTFNHFAYLPVWSIYLKKKYFDQVDHLDKLVHIDQINRFDLLGLGLNIEVCPVK